MSPHEHIKRVRNIVWHHTIAYSRALFVFTNKLEKMKFVIAFFLSALSFSEVLAESGWPDGQYCLPMPANQRCPIDWVKGYRYHDTQDFPAHNGYFNKRNGHVPHLSVSFAREEFVQMVLTQEAYFGMTKMTTTKILLMVPFPMVITAETPRSDFAVARMEQNPSQICRLVKLSC